MPNRINPDKLHLSKWTAVTPVRKEKHFLVTELQRDEQDQVIACVLEATLTRREQRIDWHDLQDNTVWKMGWH